MQFRPTNLTASALHAVLAAALLTATAASLPAQTQPARYLGTVTAISGDVLTVKTDAGQVNTVEVPSTAQLKRIEPGQTDLSKAAPLDFSSIAIGDRVLVNIDPNATGATPQALRIIAIKQADVAKKQQSETEQWNQGVHGLVKSIDPATGTIVVNVRAGTVTKPVTVNTTSSTILKRYAPGSVRFDQAQPAPITAIQPGDQLWARGTKNSDGSSIAADGIVSGTFLSIAGTVLSTDNSASTVTVKDLATKKPVTIRISADAQMRRLDDRVAAFLAARLKGGAAGYPGAGNAGGAAPNAGGQRSFSQSGGAGSRMDFETILERAPSIQLASLQKGEAVMIVATEDASGASAVKLLAGVEPLLEAPQAQDLLSNWSLSSGDSEAAGAQ
ncbi:MAG TPA: hypothetical protein VMT38_01675 [Terracidiphilus sp.]|nr:hypothetical protein [Terracidiphilus sp.]